MRTLFFFLSLFFASSLAAEERNYASKQMSMEFRGKTLRFEAKKNPDGTWNDTYTDGEGNPLSVLERNFIDGYNKLGEITFETTFFTSMVGSETPSLFLVTGIGPFPGFGVVPEFREYTGITLEQIRNMRLAAWDMVDFPPDEMVDIFVRAGATENAEELQALGEMYISHMQERAKKSGETLLAELLPEQIQKLWELEWQNPFNSATTDGEDVFIGFARYNALDLSEEQQKHLETLKKEFVQAATELNKLKLSGKKRAQQLIELVKGTREKLKGTLTDAQKAKLDRLMAEKPKFLSQPPTATPAEKKEDGWVPGPDSWKPGDPLPPGMLPPPPPAGRFPRPR